MTWLHISFYYETVFRVIMDLTKDDIVAVTGKQIRIIDKKRL